MSMDFSGGLSRRAFLSGTGAAGAMLAVGVLAGCSSTSSLSSADSSSSDSQSGSDSQDSSTVTSTTLDQAQLTADDLTAAAVLFKKENEAGTANEYEREYRYLVAATAMGNGEAMLYMGEVLQGNFVAAAQNSNDHVQDAIDWWQKAADNGQPRGYTNIGLLYLHQTIPGGGSDYGNVPYDAQKAVEYFQKASDAGDMKAPRQLGLCYEQGLGVDQDLNQALSYYELAYERGDSTGAVYYANFLLDGRAGTQDIDKAIQIYQNIVDTKGHDIVTCAIKLGDIYRDGQYVTKDLSKAKSYYQIAVDNAKAGSDQANEAQTDLDALG